MQAREAVQGKGAAFDPSNFGLTSGLPGLQRAGPSAPLDEVVFDFGAVYQWDAAPSITAPTTAKTAGRSSFNLSSLAARFMIKSGQDHARKAASASIKSGSASQLPARNSKLLALSPC